MCGRYRLNPADNAALQAIIDEINRREVGKEPPHPVKAEGEVFPGDRVPTVCRSRSGEIGAFAMEWGYTLPDGKRLINARMETAGEKPLFREGMASRRCLLPMSAYHEWEKRGARKRKFRIRPDGNGLHCLAGVYRFENGKPVCAVLTMEAAEEIAFIHHRMPVILPYSDGEKWLNGEDISPERTMHFQPEEGPDAPEQIRMDFLFE